MGKIALLFALLLPFSLCGLTFPETFCFKPNNNIDAYITGYLLEVRGIKPFGQIQIDKVKERVIYKIFDEEQELAVADVMGIDCFAKIDVKTDDVLIGSIWHRRFALEPDKYEIYDAQDRLIANGLMNFVGSRLKIVYLSKLIAAFNRPFFRIPASADYWHLTIHDYNLIDPKLLLIIGAFQSDLERKDSLIRTINPT